MEIDQEELNAVRSDYALLTAEERLFLELRQLPNIRLVLPEKENENSAKNDDTLSAAAAAGVSNNHGEDAMDIDYDSKYRCPSSSPEQQQQPATERTTTTTTTTSLPINVAPKRAKLKVRKTVEDL